MNQIAPLPGEAREALLRRAWYSHDARWYAAVAAELGFDAANAMNRRIIREGGRVEASRLKRPLGPGTATGIPEFLKFLAAGVELYVTPALLEMDARQVDEESYEIAIRTCFVADNVQRAGIGQGYECAVFDRIAGWHDACGLPLAEVGPAARCAKVEGRECRRLLTVGRPAGEALSEGG